MKAMKLANRVLALVAAAALSACTTVHTTKSGAVGVDRGQAMLVSSAEIEQASAQQYQQVIAAAKEKNALNRDARQLRRVRTIADRLIPQSTVFRPDAAKWQWEVNVLASDQLNAWCMAGGKIAFYSGLIDKLELTDDEIAAVMGHEIAHALREHSRERVSRSMATGMGVAIVSAALGIGQLGNDLMGSLARVTFELPNSRLHETEADRMGVELAARAGYDPHAAARLWQKMAKVSKGSPPQFLSTHPSNENRQRDLTRYAERVMPLYREALSR